MDPSKEPNANARANTKACYDMFNALMLEGFTEPQALQLLGQMMAAMVTATVFKGDEGA